MPTPNDIPLTRQHIQTLSSSDRVAEFFAALGYPSDARLPMTAESLQLPEKLADAVQSVELLTQVDDGARLLQVYLFELRSVTVARRRALMRVFRDRNADFLLVLTDDYSRLDFVLLDRDLPGMPGHGIATKSVSVVPRTLSVNRRNPGRVALRVLRRFTFTEYDHAGESDTLAQYSKLKSAFAIAEWSQPHFNNRALFSDYYLTERLPETEAWNAPERNRAFREVRALFAQARPHLSDEGKSATERLTLPLLKTLGFSPALPPLPVGEGRGEGGRGEGQGEGGHFLLHATGTENPPEAFLLAYPWNRYLDGKDVNRDVTHGESNPGAQVVGLLEAGTAPWGIVTNGKLWRLYSAKAHSRATNYYEIDLEETLASPDPGEAFRYFYLFFRAAAFGEESSFLDTLLEESGTYARELGDRLKERVFEQVFSHFAKGFINGMGGPTELLNLPHSVQTSRLSTVFNSTLTFLYRLLFLLYAESRDLLPIREVRGYHKISLQNLKEEIAAQAGVLEDEAPQNIRAAYGEQDTLYQRLLKLFEVIDQGSAKHNVPAYNGGLFMTDPDPNADGLEAETARFLQQAELPDRYLALGLDLMARDVDAKRGDLGLIDYKSLGVRQLGSIYEGLLEFKLRIAPERMAVVEGKRAEEVIPYREAIQGGRKILTGGRGGAAQERVYPKGTVYLENDRRERKATGSYYTPDYIVKYIVRQTLGPVMDEKLDALRPRLRQVERDYHALVRRKREMEKVTPDEPRLLQTNFGDELHALFEIKVLDPAMGSGHFLVEAVDYVTDRLVRFLDGFPFLGVFFEGMRRAILEEMNRQKVDVDPDRLTDVTLLKRHVLKRCIYGVDLNPMAVELAKVSLWLDCFTLGAPLSFLDHHLRAGNSLIGAMAQELDEGTGSGGQMSLFTGPFTGLLQAAEIMRGVSRITDVTLEQVKESDQLFRSFDAASKPFKQLLDIYVAQHFGVERAAEFLDMHSQDQALKMLKGQVEVPDVYEDVLEKSRVLYDEKRLFHWDLEFPEVFIDLENTKWKDDGGFDAVVGNPPYVRIQILSQTTPQMVDYFNEQFETMSGNYDIYSLFVERGVSRLISNGFLGLIIPHKFFQANYGLGLRKWLSKKKLVNQIVDFGSKQVFHGVTTYTCLLFVAGSYQDKFLVITPKEPKDILHKSKDGKTMLPNSILNEKAWSFENLALLAITQRIRKFSDSLSEVTSRIFQGIKTSADKIYILDVKQELEDTFLVYSNQCDKVYELEKELLYPLIKGGDVNRYTICSTSRVILFPYSSGASGKRTLISEHTLSRKYPRVYSYLLENKNNLEAREHGGFVDEQWYRYGRNQAIDIIDQSKIFTPDLASVASYALDRNAKYYFTGGAAGGYGIVADASFSRLYLLVILNSNLVDVIHHSTSTVFRGGWFSYESRFIKNLPIRHIHFTTPEPERQRLTADLITLYSGGEYETLLAQVESLLPKDEKGEFLAFHEGASGAEEKSDVVHDLLAHLAEQMIEMNKTKQSRVEAFWADLERVTTPGDFDELRNRGKWEKSLASAESCRPYVDAESRSTKHIDESLGWDEDCFHAFAGMLIGKSSLTPKMTAVYREHHSAYKGLVGRIESTDDLIDQVVYRLYGLTDEEVGVVEGQNAVNAD